jgi:cytochrome c-type biogenesis protein CcmH/NrfF
LRARLRRSNLKLIAVFLAALGALVAQDPTSYLTPDVMRVGQRLACRCGGCRNTVGDCPMLRCGSADPMRRRVSEMKKAGLSDDAVVNAIVREQGAVALASPPTGSLGGFITWIMPGLALLAGFLIYSFYVRRHRKQPEPLSSFDRAVIDRFKDQIDRELDDSPGPGSATGKNSAGNRK